MSTYELIQSFLERHDEASKEAVYKALPLISWDAVPEDIVKAFNRDMENPVIFASTTEKKGAETRIVMTLTYKGESTDIKISDSSSRIKTANSDLVIKMINQVVNDDYEVRFFKASLYMGPELAFAVLDKNQWSELESRFGKDTVGAQFHPTTLSWRLLDITNFDVITELIALLEHNPNANFDNLCILAQLIATEKWAKEAKARNLMGLKEYGETMFSVAKDKDKIIKEHGIILPPEKKEKKLSLRKVLAYFVLIFVLLILVLGKYFGMNYLHMFFRSIFH